jgi:hypothetical protein
MQSTSKPVEILGWISAASTALVGALALIDGVPSWVVAVVAAIGVVATKLLSYATTKQVTPWKDVVAKVTPQGQVVAGPAADANTPPQHPVDVGDEVEVSLKAA